MASSLGVVIFSSLSGAILYVWSEDPINWRNVALFTSTVATVALLDFAGFMAVLALRALDDAAGIL